MAKISEIISKYIISLYNGRTEGVVENVLFDCVTNKAKFLTVYNNFSDTTFVLPVNRIYSIGNAAITIRNNSALSLSEDKELEVSKLCNPINSSVFLINGDFIGITNDAILDDNYYISASFIRSAFSLTIS